MRILAASLPAKAAISLKILMTKMIVLNGATFGQLAPMHQVAESMKWKGTERVGQSHSEEISESSDRKVRSFIF
jgi:hypothetical protein